MKTVATEETAVDSIASLKLSASKNAVSEKDVTIGLFGKGGIKSDYLVSPMISLI